MSDAGLSAKHAVSRAAARAPLSGRRRQPADEVALAAYDAERLAHDMYGRNYSQGDLHDFEERAQAIAAALLAPFRGRSARPVNQPASGRGGKAW